MRRGRHRWGVVITGNAEAPLKMLPRRIRAAAALAVAVGVINGAFLRVEASRASGSSVYGAWSSDESADAAPQFELMLDQLDDPRGTYPSTQSWWPVNRNVSRRGAAVVDGGQW